MKKSIYALLISLLFISCSSSDNQSMSSNILTSFVEPYYVLGATEATVETEVGSGFFNIPGTFEMGTTMRYESEQNGVIHYYFILDDDRLLRETAVSFEPGVENVNFLRNFLEDNYTYDSEFIDNGLRSIIFNSSTSMTVELRYRALTYSDIFVFYSN